MHSMSLLTDRDYILQCLCPYIDGDRPVQESVDRFRSILALAQEALEAFKNLQLNHFDPLVGDNACQLRAYMFIKLINEPSFREELFRTLDVIREVKSVLDVQRDLQMKKPMVQILEEKKALKATTLDQYLSDLGLNKPIARLASLVTYSYFLTITKSSDVQFEIDETVSKLRVVIRENADKNISKIRPDLGITSKSDKKLKMIAKKALSQLSVSFIQEEAHRVDTKDGLLNKLSNEYVKIDEYGMQHSPCLAGMKVLLHNALSDQTFIFLKIQRINEDTGLEIDQCNLLYRPNTTRCRYELVLSSEKDLPANACYVIRAVSIRPENETLPKIDFIKDLEAKNLTDFIIAFCACHPPYGGALKDCELPYPDEERKQLQQIALEEGFCQENPQRCSLLHVYAGRIPQPEELEDFREFF